MKSFSTHSVIFVAVAIFTFVPSALSAQGGRPADSVNPFIGASTNVDAAGAYHGLGKTFPGAATPFGMVQVSPNTITGGDNGSGYSYEHTTVEGRLKERYGCVECNPLQQGWFVPHDPDGMTELMGGREKVIADLNDMFERTPDNMMWNLYYNHANEPVHFVPYLFNRIGASWLTQKWTRHICRKAYSNKVEGLCGNEDVGQMSAWYVLSAIGLHQYCPGDTRVEITSPVFDKVTVRLDSDYYSGRRFVIKAVDNSPENIYIQRAELNGRPLDACHIDFSDITAGGELVLYMGPQPNKDFGTAGSMAR